MGIIGVWIIVYAISLGATTAGIALGVFGLILTSLGFRFGFCPSCTIIQFLAKKYPPTP